MAGQKILIADDDPVSLTFVKSLLEDRGYEVVTTEDGESAMTALRVEQPDLFLTDVVMPYKSGFEILREMRRDPVLSIIPVVFLTMKDKEMDIVQALDQGAEDYLVKPVHALELVARVKKILQRAVVSAP